MNFKTDPIKTYLETSKEISKLCSQNGWIINDSIEYEILQKSQNGALIYVNFLESIMEGSGCQCDQKSCYGRIQLTLDNHGEVISSLIV